MRAILDLLYERKALLNAQFKELSGSRAYPANEADNIRARETATLVAINSELAFISQAIDAVIEGGK
jgi:hypothetical protein